MCKAPVIEVDEDKQSKGVDEKNVESKMNPIKKENCDAKASERDNKNIN
jgi:hypothetical protein